MSSSSSPRRHHHLRAIKLFPFFGFSSLITDIVCICCAKNSCVPCLPVSHKVLPRASPRAHLIRKILMIISVLPPPAVVFRLADFLARIVPRLR